MKFEDALKLLRDGKEVTYNDGRLILFLGEDGTIFYRQIEQTKVEAFLKEQRIDFRGLWLSNNSYKVVEDKQYKIHNTNINIKDINWCLYQILKGNKVRRSCWQPGHYWHLSVDRRIVNSINQNPVINSSQLRAKDWMIFTDEKNIIELRCPKCKRVLAIENMGKRCPGCGQWQYYHLASEYAKSFNKIEKIKNKTFGERIDEEHNTLIKEYYGGSLVKYLSSSGVLK